MKTSLSAKIKGVIALKLLQVPVPRKRVDAFLKKGETCSMAKLLLDRKQLDMARMHRALFERCEEVQRTALLELVRTNAQTVYGKEHHFSEIRTVEDFRREVPISEWSDFEEYIADLKQGASDILFAGKTQYFNRTTGTTGAVKPIPVSERDIIARQLVGKLQNLERARACGMMAEFLDRKMKIFTMNGTVSVERTEGGVPIGSASGITARLAGGSDNGYSMMVVPTMLANHFEGNKYFYMAMRCALFYRNVGVAFGNNPKQMENMILYAEEHAEELIEDIRKGTSRYELPDDVKEAMREVLVPAPERAGELMSFKTENRFIPKYYWPDLAAGFFWLSGSIGEYADDLRAYLPKDVQFMDIGYGASEAKINIPLAAESPAGALLTYTLFYEFLPEDGGEPLMAHELEAGKDYELLLTTNSGLYRYRIHDIVHVDGFIGDTPLIHFETKAGDIANLVGEKMKGTLLLEKIRDALADRFGIAALQIYPDPAARRYVIYIEPDGDAEDNGDLAQQIDRYMTKHVPMFDWARDMALEEPIVKLMPRGWGQMVFEEYAQGKQNRTQVKVPIVRGEPYIGD